MPVRLTAFLPDRPAIARWLDDPGPLSIGRAATADVCLDHRSVSREHAEIRQAGEQWLLHDCGSKNGSFVDGIRISEPATLHGQSWLRFGDVNCEFSTFDAVAAGQAAQREHDRRTQSTALGERLAQQDSLPGMLQETLRSVVALVECERGFLLQPEPSGWRVQACHGLPADALAQEFSGSSGALERALAERVPVVVNDTRLDPSLARRASVVTGGIRSLVAIPLLNGREVLALVYADRSGVAEPLTEFDVQLLEAFCERAALWIVARRGVDALTELPPLDWPSLVAARA